MENWIELNFTWCLLWPPMGHTGDNYLTQLRENVPNLSFKLLANATCRPLDFPWGRGPLSPCCCFPFMLQYDYLLYSMLVYSLLAQTTLVASWPVWAELNQNLNCVNCAYFDWIFHLALSLAIYPSLGVSLWQCGLPKLFGARELRALCSRWLKGLATKFVAWKYDNCWLITGKQNLKLIKFALMAKALLKRSFWLQL